VRDRPAAAVVMALFIYEAVTNPASQPTNAPPLIAYDIVTAVVALIAAAPDHALLAGLGRLHSALPGARRSPSLT
jgi:hypothetical protein